MRFLTDLQHRFGFTGNEFKVILFLSLSLVAGMGIKWLRSGGGATGGILPTFDYSRSDSEFAARSLSLTADTIHSYFGTPSRTVQHKQTLTPGCIDINSASKQQLILLPGIGESIASRIIAYRDENGPFSSVDRLVRVKGIGAKKLEKIRPFVTAGPTR